MFFAKRPDWTGYVAWLLIDFGRSEEVLLEKLHKV